MSKFYGKIGFSKIVNSSPGVWKEDIVERDYVGDLIRMSISSQNSNNINDNVMINHKISIVCDNYAYDNHNLIRYVILNNSKWKVTNIEIERPRLILSLGGIFNG